MCCMKVRNVTIDCRVFTEMQCYDKQAWKNDQEW